MGEWGEPTIKKEKEEFLNQFLSRETPPSAEVRFQGGEERMLIPFRRENRTLASTTGPERGGGRRFKRVEDEKEEGERKISSG